jgi:hypothetical protein
VSRVKTDVRQALTDLVLVAKHLPEKHLADVFAAETVVPFILSLIETPREATGDQRKRMERAGNLCRELLQQISFRGPALAGRAKKFLLAAKTDTMIMDLQALLIGDESVPKLPKTRVRRR